MLLHPLTHLPPRTVALIHLLVVALLVYLYYAPACVGGLCCIFLGATGLSLGRLLATLSGRGGDAVALG